MSTDNKYDDKIQYALELETYGSRASIKDTDITAKKLNISRSKRIQLADHCVLVIRNKMMEEPNLLRRSRMLRDLKKYKLSQIDLELICIKWDLPHIDITIPPLW